MKSCPYCGSVFTTPDVETDEDLARWLQARLKVNHLFRQWMEESAA